MRTDTIGELSQKTVHSMLTCGMRYRIGPFTIALKSSVTNIASLLHSLYSDSMIASDDVIADFHIRLHRPLGPRRWIKPKINFISDGRFPMDPLPLDTAFPLLEWGINWCITMHAHQYLMLHAGIVEKNGKAIIFPASPGSGKSTLCAALMHNSWRLLSDEFGLVRRGTTGFTPLPRCIPLKNESIDVIGNYCPDAVIGPTFPKTRKGDVAHIKPTTISVQRSDDTAHAMAIVFPQYKKNAACRLNPIAKPRAFMKLSHNAFNYELQGKQGFETIANLVNGCDCHLFEYSNLDDAIALFDEMVAD